MYNQNASEFLKELTALTLKYKLKIGGCGCCGSPFVTELEIESDSKPVGYTVVPNDDYLDFLTFNLAPVDAADIEF